MSNITHSRKSPTLRTYKREIIIKECYKLSLNDTQLCSMLVRIMDENDGNIPVVKSACVYSLTRIKDSLSIKYIVTGYKEYIEKLENKFLSLVDDIKTNESTFTMVTGIDIRYAEREINSVTKIDANGSPLIHATDLETLRKKFGVDIYWMKDINIIKYVVRVSTIYHVVSSDGFVFVNGKWEYKSSKSELQLINAGS